MWASRGNAIYKTENLGERWIAVVHVHDNWRALVTHFRLVDRFLRYSVFSLVVDESDRILATVNDRQYYASPGQRYMVRTVASPINFKPIRRNICVTAKGDFLIGEYRHNFGEHRGQNIRNAAHVYCSRDGGRSFDILYTFPRGTIRHIHSILNDPYRPGRIWITTGDEDDESHIHYTDDYFRSLTEFKGGSQTYRVTDLFFSEDYIYWGMDSPRQDCYIYRCRRDGSDESRLAETPLPVYFGSTNEARQIFFSDSVEGGPSAKGRETSLYYSVDGNTFRKAIGFRADFTPQFSQIHFPQGVLPENYVVFYPRCTYLGDNMMYLAKVGG